MVHSETLVYFETGEKPRYLMGVARGGQGAPAPLQLKIVSFAPPNPSEVLFEEKTKNLLKS